MYVQKYPVCEMQYAFILYTAICMFDLVTLTFDLQPPKSDQTHNFICSTCGVSLLKIYQSTAEKLHTH